MFNNYFRIAIRNLKKQHLYFGINIIGLGIALGACFLLLLYTFNEFNYDRYHPNVDQTYRIIRQDTERNEFDGQTPYPMAELIRNNIPEIENVSQLHYQSIKISLKDMEQSQPLDFVFADNKMFELFETPIITGLSPEHWSDPLQLYISESIADRYFKGTNAVNQTISINENNYPVSFVIAGVFKTLPSNTHLNADIIAPVSIALKIYEVQEFMGFRFHAFNSWKQTPIYTYIQLNKTANINTVEQKIKKLIPSDIEEAKNTNFHLQPLNEIYLHSNHIHNNNWLSGNIQQILLLLAIALLILCVAVFNFILLATAISNTRLKEIGMRKVLGAYNKDIVRQTLTESILIAFTSLPIALLFAEVLQPMFNKLMQRDLQLLNVGNWLFFISITGITVFVGILSGSYTAFKYSRFHPYQIFKTAGIAFLKKSKLRQILITTQFVVFVGLLICTFTILRQFHFLQHKDLGYNKEHLITIPLINKQTVKSYQILKNRLHSNAKIVNISGASYTPPTGSCIRAHFEGAKKTIEYITVDFDYFSTMGIPIIEGAEFSVKRQSMKDDIMITASAVPYLELEQPIGQQVPGLGHVVGVVDDFHVRSLHRNIEPIMFKVDPANISTAIVRLQPNSTHDAIKDIRQMWKEVNPDIPFSFQFVDDALNNAYQKDIRFGRLIQLFTILAVVIASIGLFGLAMFMTLQKTKEISTRKILGASFVEIVSLLTKDIFRWVIVANFIAWPIAWFAINKWLQNYAYRTEINMWVFVLPGISSLIIALASVSYQTVRAAFKNPVEVLRNE